MKEFSDKVAVIAGAASGIGLGIAEKFYIPTDYHRFLRRGVQNEWNQS